ncbi:MAG TPA: hypothetical protein VFB15_11460 [Candidatus Binataceae bacterium]|jgi:hypothetical protein|nr:hypothetical protein [Candidatus Binataceae bacterium]
MNFSVPITTPTTGTEIATINKTENGQAVNVQRTAIDTDQLSFGTEGVPTYGALMAAPQPVGTLWTSAALSCLGDSKIVLKTEYSASQVIAALRVVLVDNGGVMTPMPLVEPQNTGYSGNVSYPGYFHGELATVPTNGASSYYVQIAPRTPAAAGNVMVWADSI